MTTVPGAPLAGENPAMTGAGTVVKLLVKGATTLPAKSCAPMTLTV